MAASTFPPSSPGPSGVESPRLSGRAPKVSFIFITVLLDVLGFGLLIPVSPRLVERFMGLPEVGAEGQAAWAVGALAATYACMQFIFAPILGSLSDRVGRRPVILISLLGSGIDYLAAALATLFFPHLWILFLTRIINGISGANISACSAYIADITSPEKRAGAYGMLGAAFGLGFMFGPLTGGLVGDPNLKIPIIGHGAIHYPYILAGVLTLINWLFGYFVLPESLPKERRRAFDWGKANPLGALVWLTRHRVVIRLAVSLLLINVAQFGLHVTWVLSMSARFRWTTSQVAVSLFIVGVCAALVQGVLARKIIPMLGERACVLGGIGIGVLAFLGYAFATEGWMIYVLVAFASLGGVAGPALQSITTKAVPPTEQGLLQGSLSGLSSIATIIGALLASQIFQLFTASTRPAWAPLFPGAPFLSGALLTLLSVVPVLIIWNRLPSSVKQSPVES